MDCFIINLKSQSRNLKINSMQQSVDDGWACLCTERRRWPGWRVKLGHVPLVHQASLHLHHGYSSLHGTHRCAKGDAAARGTAPHLHVNSFLLLPLLRRRLLLSWGLRISSDCSARGSLHCCSSLTLVLIPFPTIFSWCLGFPIPFLPFVLLTRTILRVGTAVGE